MTAMKDKSRNLISSHAFSEAVPPMGRGRNQEVRVMFFALVVISVAYRAVLRMMWPQQLYPLLNLIGHSTAYHVATGADRKL